MEIINKIDSIIELLTDSNGGHCITESDIRDAVIELNSMKNLKITLDEYETTCGDGCCTDYGTITYVNNVKLECHNQDIPTIIQQILEHLGYNVDIECLYNEEQI